MLAAEENDTEEGEELETSRAETWEVAMEDEASGSKHWAIPSGDGGEDHGV
jgi:hypothetical protein